VLGPSQGRVQILAALTALEALAQSLYEPAPGAASEGIVAVVGGLEDEKDMKCDA
jgi:hypothetical protein